MTTLALVHAATGSLLLATGVTAALARKRKAGIHAVVGELYFWLLAATLVMGMKIGATHPGISVFEIATPPTFLLGFLGWLAAKRRPLPFLGKPWLHWHLTGMSGSFIGVVTASLFQVVPRLVRVPGLTIALFVLPTVVGSVLVRRARAKWLAAEKPVVAALE